MKKSRYSLFVALALAAISTSACEDTVSLSVKCDGNHEYWAERNDSKIKGGECNGGVVGPIEFDVELDLSKGEKAVVCNKNGCEDKRYILSVTDDKRIVAKACKEGDIECDYCCGNDGIAKCTDSTNAGKTNALCGDVGDENTSYQCKGSSVIVQKCESGCVDGKCKGANIEGCENGTHQCNGDKIEICVDGDWKDAVGAQLCDSAKIWKCNDSGVAEAQLCGDGAVCKDGECKASVCANSSVSGPVCNGGKVGKCENGNWIESKGNDLCEDDKILYCENEDVTPRRVGCYSNDDKTHVCKGGEIDDSGCGNGKECNNSECKPKKYTCTAEDKYICANGGMLYDCNEKTSQKVDPASDNNLMCEDSKVVWCKQENNQQTVNDKHTANKTECSPNGSVKGCAEWCTACDQNGSCTECNKPLERCTDNLQRKTVCSNNPLIKPDSCDYCYNSDFENGWVDVGGLVCGCDPNKYKEIGDNHTVCYKGEWKALTILEDNNDTISINNDDGDKIWEFALRVGIDSDYSWNYYNCHNAKALKKIEGTDSPSFSVDCCKENSYYIRRTGYRYYQVELCKSRRQNLNPNGTSYQFDEGLNDALIGKDNDFLQNDIACLNVKKEFIDNSIPTILIKDTSIEVINDSAVYQAFKCPGDTVCNFSHKQLCMGSKKITTEQVYCEPLVQNGKSRIMQLQEGKSTRVAECPKDTVLQIMDKATQDWRVVETADCGTNKTHNLDDFRCYFKDEKQQPTM